MVGVEKKSPQEKTHWLETIFKKVTEAR